MKVSYRSSTGKRRSGVEDDSGICSIGEWI